MLERTLLRRTGAVALLISAGCGDADDLLPARPWSAQGDAGADALAQCPEPISLGAGDMRRLSRSEYENTLRGLFGDTTVDAVAFAVKGVPEDRVGKDFSTLSIGVTSSHIDAYFGVAESLAAYVSADSARLGALEACLGASPIADDCVKAFIAKFGRKVYRRPLSDAETSSLSQTYTDAKAVSSADGVRFVLFAMLQSPAFIYRVEIGGDPPTVSCASTPNAYLLTDYELASRLSYLAWGSGPDDELLDAAANGALASEAGLEHELDRLFADPRAGQRVQRFFMEWLNTDHLPALSQSDAFFAGIPKTDLIPGAQAELDAFLGLHFEKKSAFADLFTSNVSIVKSPALAQLYGVTPAPDGTVTFGDAIRNGLLARAALLMTGQGGEQTNPVRRGAAVQRIFTCVDLRPPDPKTLPPDALTPPPFSPDKSNRDRWTEKTSAPMCASCHGQFNGFGFALESYDPIGRYRTTEKILDPATGAQVNELPINSTVDVILDGTPATVAGAAALENAIAESPGANRCFGRQWFRFVSGRMDLPEDKPAIDAIVGTGGASVQQMFKALAKTPAFRVRRFTP